MIRLAFSLLALLFGLALFLFPRWAASLSARAHARRLAEREARGADAYFEEARQLRAYPPRPAWMWSVTGAIIALAGALMFLDAAAGAFMLLNPITR